MQKTFVVCDVLCVDAEIAQFADDVLSPRRAEREARRRRREEELRRLEREEEERRAAREKRRAEREAARAAEAQAGQCAPLRSFFDCFKRF